MSRLIESTLAGKISNILVESENEKKICPRCGRVYTGYPAVSRYDNKTEICSDCGTDEAMIQFSGGKLEKPTAAMDAISFKRNIKENCISNVEITCPECSEKFYLEVEAKNMDSLSDEFYSMNKDCPNCGHECSDSDITNEDIHNDFYESAKLKESELEKGKEILNEKGEKDFNVEHADDAKISELEDGSAFTFEGLDASDKSLKGLVDFLKEKTTLKTPVTIYTWSGKEFNDKYGLTGNNAYPDDLTFVSIALDSWEKLGNLPMLKFQVGARWLDDIVDNNARREGYNESVGYDPTSEELEADEKKFKDKKKKGIEDRIGELKTAIQDGVSDDEKAEMEKEIADLEKQLQECDKVKGRGKKSFLSEGKWNATIKSGSELRKLLNELDEDASIEECQRVLDVLKKCCEEAKTLTNDEYYQNGFQSVIDDIEMIYDDEELDSSNVDWELDGFYDYCDGANLWVSLNEPETGEIISTNECDKSLKEDDEYTTKVLDEFDKLMQEAYKTYSYDEFIGLCGELRSKLDDYQFRQAKFMEGAKPKTLKEEVLGDYSRLNNEVKQVVENTFEGSDFIVNEVELRDNGTIHINISAYGNEENENGDTEMNRDVEIQVPELNYLDAVANACTDWMLAHNSPDNFYESDKSLEESVEVATNDGSTVSTGGAASVQSNDGQVTVTTEDTTVVINSAPALPVEDVAVPVEEPTEDLVAEVPEETPVEEVPTEEPVEDEQIEESDEIPTEDKDEYGIDATIEAKSLRVVKNQGSVYMLEIKETNGNTSYWVCENFNAETNEGDNAEVYTSKEEADKDYFERVGVSSEE